MFIGDIFVNPVKTFGNWYVVMKRERIQNILRMSKMKEIL